MFNAQPGILADIPRVARYLTFQLAPGADPREALAALRIHATEIHTGALVVGIGPALVRALDVGVDGLHELSPRDGPGFGIPVTPAAVWCWLRGEDRGQLVHATRALAAGLDPALDLVGVIDAFQHRDSRDLSGYIDGTENPVGAEARAAGFAADGSSFVAVQQWVHDLDRFEAMSELERDHTIGRRISDNEEIDDAPESAHVKRTAQETFEPTAFMVRRSMPWADDASEGLVFVAFGSSLDAFERQLQRMVGLDDGVVDALFGFTRPVTGAAFWCPPIADGQLDLKAVGL